VQLSLQSTLALALGASWPARLAAAAAPSAPQVPSESTRQMEALIRKIMREANPLLNPYRCSEQVALLRPLVAQAANIQQAFNLRTQLAGQLLLAARPEEALAEYEGIERMVQENAIPLDETGRSDLRMKKAVCYVRIGEQENWCVGHNASSALFPVTGSGIHTKPRGSRAAIALLTEQLGKHPGDLRARWLLNICYMTLGEYPNKVPGEWLLDPKLFASDFDIKHFPDVAPALGLDIDGPAGGVVLEDFDNDGFIDVMVSSWALDGQIRYFRNNGDGTFSERTAEAGLTGVIGGININSCDYNNDGFADVLVMRGAWIYKEGHYPFSLLRNNGDGTFTDVTVEAGLLRLKPSSTSVWWDYNLDGWLDLFVGTEATPDDKISCSLYRNNGDGTFTECAAQHGLDIIGFVKGAHSADYNNDGRPDLLISRMNGPPLLFRNDGPDGDDTSPKATWRFTEVAQESGISRPMKSFPCWFFDFDNNGWPDVFISGYEFQDVGDVAADYLGLPNAGQLARLYRNNGDGTFADVSREYGVNRLLRTMGANFGDLDNDGWLDFYAGTGDPDFATLIPHRMFRNDEGKRFQDVTASGGFGQLQKGHGIGFADINNDGTQDIYSVVGGAAEGDHFRHQLFANPGHGNNWIKLKLEGVQTNRAGFGARIKVVARTQTGEREIHRIVGTGGSFGTSCHRQEIGLGKAQSIRKVEIYWPVSRSTQVLTGLEMNKLYHVREGADSAEPVELRSFKWPTMT
jgi:hypothetical protein